MRLTWILTLLPLANAATPGCSGTGFVAPPQHILSNVRTGFFNFSQAHPGWGYPLGVVYAQQSGAAFVALSKNLSKDTSSLLVLDTTTFIPSAIQDIPFPNSASDPDGAAGITKSHSGKYVYVAAGNGAFVVNAEAAIQKSAKPITGFLNGNTGTSKKQKPGTSAFGITISNDDKYVFVLQEYGVQDDGTGNVDVFQVNPSTGLGKAVGFIPLGLAVTSGIFSPDGEDFYVVSEVAGYKGNKALPGTISVLNTSTLEKNPSKSLIGQTSTDCGAVRDVLTKDGKTLWVTNRGNNSVWAFDTARILSDPSNAHIATVNVGTAPVGLALVKNDTRLLVADSNRFYDIYSDDYKPRATAGISVVDTTAALSGATNANLGQIPSGFFPREFAVSPDGETALVTNWNSRQIQAIDLSTLP